MMDLTFIIDENGKHVHDRFDVLMKEKEMKAE